VVRQELTSPSLALSNLKSFVIVIVLAAHSVLAYLASLPRSSSSSTTRPIDGGGFRSSTASAGSAST
jgi:hypothetical protein